MDLLRTFEGYFAKVLRSSGLSASEYGDQLDKSRALYEKSLLYCPSMGHLEPCRIFICIELTLAKHKIVIDRAFNIRFSGLTSNEYLSAMQFLSNELALDLSKISVKVLAITTGYDQLIGPCEKLLNVFISRFCITISEESRLFVTPDNPELLVAIFISVITCLKFRIDKKSILQKYSINEKTFQNYLQSIRNICRTELQSIQLDSLLFKELKKQQHNSTRTKLNKDRYLELYALSILPEAEQSNMSSRPRLIYLLPEHIKYAGRIEEDPDYYLYKTWRDSLVNKENVALL